MIRFWTWPIFMGNCWVSWADSYTTHICRQIWGSTLLCTYMSHADVVTRANNLAQCLQHWCPHLYKSRKPRF